VVVATRKTPRGGAADPGSRDGVLARLRAVVDGAATGHGQLLLLAGEAGIGKTTMLTQAARYAESRGVRVAWSWGWPGEGAPGYWPWVQVLRALGLDMPWPGDADSAALEDAPASDRFQLFDEVTSALLAESRIQPLLVLLDDLQWADQASQLLLDFLARRLPAGAAAVIGSYRDVDPAPGPVLSDLAARTVVLPLTGLAADAVTQLVADIVGEQRAADVAADVHRRTGGNPFFAQQVSWLLKVDQDGVPPGVQEALGRRIAGLPVACAEALRIAAVVGQQFPVHLLAAVAGEPPGVVAGSLTEAVRARVVSQDEPAGYRFAHDLFREYAYGQLPAADRAVLHQRIGRLLEAERARGGDVSLAELAQHFVQADPASPAAGRYCVAAAREAARRLAYEEAVRHWEHALRAAGEGMPTTTEMLLELAEAQRRAGEGQAASQAYLRVAELARAGPDTSALARAALGLQALGSRAWFPPTEVVALLAEALDGLPAGPADGTSGLLRLRVMASMARVLAWHGLNLPRARALAAEAVDAARASGDHITLAACLLAQHHAVWAPGTAQERLRIAGEIADLAERADDREVLLEARLLAATDRLELADPAFRSELDEFLRLADTARQPRFRYAALVRHTMLALLAGRFPEAGRLLEQAGVLGEECGEPGTRDVRYDQGWDLLTGQGRLGELAGSLPDMFPDPESVQARGSRALVLLAAGARAEAADAVAPIMNASPDSVPHNHQWLGGMAYAAEIVAAFGARPAAQAWYAALLPYADQAVVSGAAITFRGSVAHYLGVLAAVLGQTGEAAALLERAVTVHERLGALPWSLRSRYELARVRLSEPAQRDAALSALASLARTAHQLGMTQLARDAEAAGFAAGQAPLASGVFARDGATWTLGYGGVTVQLRDAKGLADLAVLLAAPGQQIAAADLVAAAGAGQAGRADLLLGADEVLDATARQQIRARLAELGEDIAEAESWSDPERATRARAERDALLHEVAAATGLSGRTRLLGDQSERARKAVTARIRDVMTRIDQAHPALGAHLRASVTTGTRCAYSPATPVTWQLTR
jgi:AAA ATPase domain